ncbi:S-locus glycoprotein domain containing protein [Parasponia andersonii]|uniref:S-locus glycoprotein domain containing protein n=1 Tax=Parasponia andersonii TaxID=3476 RepID=A0A2P5E4S5_PARAD|nr:S-locus glycoprotein domain containing protein [Parasponia andersonii]
MNVVNSSTISQMVLDLSGQVTQQIWLPANGWTVIWSFPRQQCQVYAFCGAYGSCSENSLPFCRCLTGFEPKSEGDRDLKDYSGGCIRKNRLQCGDSNLRNGESDRFLGVPRMSLPENQQFVQGISQNVNRLA